MGISPFWQEDFFLTIQNAYHSACMSTHQPYFMVKVNDSLVVHLIPLDNPFSGVELAELQHNYQTDNILLVQLWQDVWLTKRQQVLNRIHSFLGLNQNVHGRKCKIVDLSPTEATRFFKTYHLQGDVKAQQTSGLTLDGELLSAASFSKVRPMKNKGPQYHSAELVRFASKDNFTVVGGLSKLIRHFLKTVAINDLMTYADRDWSVGKGYDRLGFNLSEITKPADIYVNQASLTRFFPHRLPKSLINDFETEKNLNFDEYLAKHGYVRIFNTGNLKYHLYL